MQNGSVMRSTRLRGPDVWEFRWREAGADGKRKYRRMVIGSTAQFSDKSSALLEVAVLRRKINLNHPHLCPQAVTVSELGEPLSPARTGHGPYLEDTLDQGDLPGLPE